MDRPAPGQAAALLAERNVSKKRAWLQTLTRDQLLDLGQELQALHLADSEGAQRPRLRIHIGFVEAFLSGGRLDEIWSMWLQRARDKRLTVGSDVFFKTMRILVGRLGEAFDRIQDPVMSSFAKALHALHECDALNTADEQAEAVPRFVLAFTAALPGDASAKRANAIVSQVQTTALYADVETFGDDVMQCVISAAESAAGHLASCGWPEGGGLLLASIAKDTDAQGAPAIAMFGRFLELSSSLSHRPGFAMLQAALGRQMPPSVGQLKLSMDAMKTLTDAIRANPDAPPEWRHHFTQIARMAWMSAGAKSGIVPEGVLEMAVRELESLVRLKTHPLHKMWRAELMATRALQGMMKVTGAASALQPLFSAMSVAAQKPGTNLTKRLADLTEDDFRRGEADADRISAVAGSRNLPVTEIARQLSGLVKKDSALGKLFDPEQKGFDADAFVKNPDAEIRRSSESIYSACQSAETLIGLERLTEAKALLHRLRDVRRECFDQAVSFDDARAILFASAKLPSLLAWVHWRENNVRLAVETLANEGGVMFASMPAAGAPAATDTPKDALRRHAQNLQAHISRLRFLLANAGAASAGPLRFKLDDAVTEWKELMEASPDARAWMTYAQVAALRPAGGAIVTLATTRHGALAFMVLPDGSPDVVHLPELTRQRQEEILQSHITDEAAFSKSLDTDDPFALAAFNDVLMATCLALSEIVAPIEARLTERGIAGTEPISFVGMGLMEHLPLHAACRMIGGRPRFLIQDRVIRQAPSFAHLAHMKRRAARIGSGLCDVAAFIAPQKEPAKKVDLESAIEVELPGLQKLPGLQVEPYLMSQATKAALMTHLANLAGEGTPVAFHAAMHAYYHWALPELSALRLVDPTGSADPATVLELLQLGELDALSHACLSSCHTGKSDLNTTAGEGIGLVELFLYLGSPSVLSSHYPIIDQTTAETVPAIYQARLAGADLGEALRNVILQRFDDNDFLLVHWAAFKPTCS